MLGVSAMKTSMAPFSTQIVGHGLGQAVHLLLGRRVEDDQEMGLAHLGRPLFVDMVLGQGDGLDLEELDGQGNDAPLHDERDGLEGRLELLEGHDERAHEAGLGLEMEDDLGDDAEGAFGADDEVHEVVARARLLELAAEPEDLARRA